MISLEQLVQNWLDLDKVRICLVNWDPTMLHCMVSRKRQGPRSRNYGNQEITRNWRVGSGTYLPDRRFITWQ